MFTAIGLILGANVLHIANVGGKVAGGSALVSVLFIVIGAFTGLKLNATKKGIDVNK
jgi:hypothetical protein